MCVCVRGGVVGVCLVLLVFFFLNLSVVHL